MNLLEKLNPDQKKAVEYTEGPLIILAGAGSGKTKALTYRVAHLIKNKGINSRNILAITFTNKAANEMKERIKILIGNVVHGMWIGTFHATCVRILRRDIERLGFKRNFLIYDDDDRIRLITECLKDLNYDTKKFAPRTIKNKISAAKNELLDAETFVSQAISYPDKIAAEVYQLYQERITKNNALDFDDLIMMTVDLLNLFPSILEFYRDEFRYILVDEYQDTNHAQYKLINLLAGKHKNLCVVGDPDQSIYKFRGADIRNILEFELDYPEAKIVRLEQNYRSTQVILDASNHVIKNNLGRKPKALWTKNAAGELIVHFQSENEREEAAFIAGEIERLSKEKKRSYKDFAIFYRTNAQSRVLEETFIGIGLPYEIVGGLRFYERKEIKDILAYLRVISSPMDSVGLKRIINVPIRGIGKTTIAYLDKFAIQQRISFYEAIKKVEKNPWLSASTKKKVEGFSNMLESFEKAKEDDIQFLVEKVLDVTGYLTFWDKQKTFESIGRVENIKEFISVVVEFKNAFPGKNLSDFLEHIALVTDIDSYDEGVDTVTLMTLHNAKGLEFPIVFIIGMEEGIFPHFRSIAEPEELEEERRLCYVGMTRAKEKLYLTSAWSRNLWGSTSYNLKSRFIKEIPSDLFEDLLGTALYQKGDVETTQQNCNVFSLGDKVIHKTFGEGDVVSVDEEDQITVFFLKAGRKKVFLEDTPLEKIN
ncbi:DNA helicase PcrA [Candidatus Oleimmundimicrobium sp.]|uniref:DNA helicase PcrA n=1 Tax=Candidatus Oleimmundimicrobium sp. TaxID=3060597 RepID=UPI0027290D18|nr:DNA helicase PcrA [Candidatus Oleimmundimicrobium sp.]MDO8886751.1 DNA helicase PcrA [Candidatus Oleimmundimicrobium sp.]